MLTAGAFSLIKTPSLESNHELCVNGLTFCHGLTPGGN